MQGDQTKALKIISRAKGWDPDVIVEVGKGTASAGENISNFDRATEIFVNQSGTGKIPEPISNAPPDTADSPLTERTPFNAPDFGRENANRRTSGADPFAGMGG